MYALLEPQLVNDAFGDPGLYIDFRDERRALLFDLGDITCLPPRKLMRLSHVFVTHTHMDHFSGFDQLLRVVLGRKPGIVLFGGPGFIDQVEHKLRAYTWNVVHRYDELVIDVREVGLDGTGARACFSSRSGFARSACGAYAPQGDVLHDEALLRVRGRFVDHDVPCLALAVEEKARVRIAKDRIEALGLGAGAWLRELKHAILTGAGDETVLDVQWRDRNGAHSTTRCVGELRQVVLEVAEGQRIGYVTDLCGTEANAAVLVQLLRDVDRLFIESVFLHEDEAHAARKNHLTARRAGEFARRVGARAVVPFHFSPRYEDRLDALIAELDAAWHGASDPAAPPASP